MIQHFALLANTFIHGFESLVQLVGQALRRLVNVELMCVLIEARSEDVIDARQKRRVLPFVGFANGLTVLGVRELSTALAPNVNHVLRVLRSLRPLHVASTQRDEVLLIK